MKLKLLVTPGRRCGSPRHWRRRHRYRSRPPSSMAICSTPCNARRCSPTARLLPTRCRRNLPRRSWRPGAARNAARISTCAASSRGTSRCPRCASPRIAARRARTCARTSPRCGRCSRASQTSPWPAARCCRCRIATWYPAAASGRSTTGTRISRCSGSKREQRALATDMLENFAHLIDTYGHIPNGNRTYYLSRSQPPFFAAMVALRRRARRRCGVHAVPAAVAARTPVLDGRRRETRAGQRVSARGAPAQWHFAQSLLGRSRHAARRGLSRRPRDRAPPRSVLPPRYIAACAPRRRAAGISVRAGWRMAARSPRSAPSTCCPVDLNGLMYELERAISRALAIQHDPDARHWEELAANARRRFARLSGMNSATCTRTFYGARTGCSAVTLAGLYPLYFGVAEAEQARQTARCCA